MTRTVTYLNTLGNKKRFPAKLFTALEIRNEKVKSQLVSDIREESGNRIMTVIVLEMETSGPFCVRRLITELIQLSFIASIRMMGTGN